MNNFDDVQVGDKVILEGDSFLGIYPVIKVTKTTFTAHDYVINKSTGCQKLSAWHFIQAQKGTPEAIAKVLPIIKHKNRVKIAKTINFEALSLEQLEKIIEIAGL